MGTPEVLKPHSIWVLEHRLCPGMSPCFRGVATRVATQSPISSLLHAIASLFEPFNSFDKVSLIGDAVERGFHSPPAVTAASPERRQRNSYPQEELQRGAGPHGVWRDGHADQRCAMESSIGEDQMPQRVNQQSIYLLHSCSLACGLSFVLEEYFSMSDKHGYSRGLETPFYMGSRALVVS